MFNNLFRNYIYPIATLSASIIGVGFLSLPYVTLQSGIWLMLFYFVIFTCIITLLHVIFGEIALKTPDFKRWPGFVEYYFGAWAKKLILIPIILGSFGVLLAYIIVGSDLLYEIFNPFFGGSISTYFFIYFAVLATIIFFGATITSRINFAALVLLAVVFLIIIVQGFSKISLDTILVQPAHLNFKSMFLPYGVILFSIWGTALIPEVEEMLRGGHKNNLKKIIIISTLIPVIVYIFFILMVLGISGANTTESALIGVKNALGNGISSIVLFVGVITTFTAFVAQGLFLKKMFVYDLQFNKYLAWLVVCFAPILLYFIGFNSFIPLISFVGGVLLGIDGILILIIYRKIGGSKWIVYPLMAVFVLGILYTLFF